MMKKIAIGLVGGFLLYKAAGKAFELMLSTKGGNDLAYAAMQGMETFIDELEQSREIAKVDDSWERRDARFDAYFKAKSDAKEKN